MYERTDDENIGKAVSRAEMSKEKSIEGRNESTEG